MAIDSPLVVPPASRVVPRLLAFAESLGTPYKRPEALAFGFEDSPEGLLYYCPVSLLSDLWQIRSLPIVLAQNLSLQFSEEKIYKLLFPPTHFLPRFIRHPVLPFSIPCLAPSHRLPNTIASCLRRTASMILPLLELAMPSLLLPMLPPPRCLRAPALRTLYYASGSSVVSELTLLRASL